MDRKEAMVDDLIAKMLPAALLFAEDETHLEHARSRAKALLVEALAQQAPDEGHADECHATAMEGWHSAVDDAGEIARNSTDQRIVSRASRVVTYLKANRPQQAPTTIDPLSPVREQVRRGMQGFYNVLGVQAPTAGGVTNELPPEWMMRNPATLPPELAYRAEKAWQKYRAALQAQAPDVGRLRELSRDWTRRHYGAPDSPPEKINAADCAKELETALAAHRGGGEEG